MCFLWQQAASMCFLGQKKVSLCFLRQKKASLSFLWLVVCSILAPCASHDYHTGVCPSFQPMEDFLWLQVTPGSWLLAPGSWSSSLGFTP